MSDVMSVRLRLSGVRVREVLVDSLDRLEVEVESSRAWSRCPQCGFRCHRVWDRRVKRVRDLEVSDRRATLVWRRRRLWCGNCEERHLEDHDQFWDGLTRRFARRLVSARPTVLNWQDRRSPAPTCHRNRPASSISVKMPPRPNTMELRRWLDTCEKNPARTRKTPFRTFAAVPGLVWVSTSA